MTAAQGVGKDRAWLTAGPIHAEVRGLALWPSCGSRGLRGSRVCVSVGTGGDAGANAWTAMTGQHTGSRHLLWGPELKRLGRLSEDQGGHLGWRDRGVGLLLRPAHPEDRGGAGIWEVENGGVPRPPSQVLRAVARRLPRAVAWMGAWGRAGTGRVWWPGQGPGGRRGRAARSPGGRHVRWPGCVISSFRWPNVYEGKWLCRKCTLTGVGVVPEKLRRVSICTAFAVFVHFESVSIQKV